MGKPPLHILISPRCQQEYHHKHTVQRKSVNGRKSFMGLILVELESIRPGSVHRRTVKVKNLVRRRLAQAVDQNGVVVRRLPNQSSRMTPSYKVNHRGGHRRKVIVQRQKEQLVDPVCIKLGAGSTRERERERERESISRSKRTTTLSTNAYHIYNFTTITFR